MLLHGALFTSWHEFRGTSCPREGHNFQTILALDRGHLVIKLVILPVPAISPPNSASMNSTAVKYFTML